MKMTLTATAVALALTALPMIASPSAQADVCGEVGGRHVAVGGCTNVAGDVAGAAVAGVAVAAVAEDDEAASQAMAGLPPCYTPEGIPFRTPAGVPCP